MRVAAFAGKRLVALDFDGWVATERHSAISAIVWLWKPGHVCLLNCWNISSRSCWADEDVQMPTMVKTAYHPALSVCRVVCDSVGESSLSAFKAGFHPIHIHISSSYHPTHPPPHAYKLHNTECAHCLINFSLHNDKLLVEHTSVIGSTGNIRCAQLWLPVPQAGRSAPTAHMPYELWSPLCWPPDSSSGKCMMHHNFHMVCAK